ncbi:MAG: hypothetical protein IJU63_00875 [Bacteroidales bacterium]|nr:hypothetical protein [Bacteroidales bacterium]
MIPHRSRLFRLALTAVLLTAALSAAAQIVNRLGVNDSVFQRWAYCRMQPYDAGNLAFADTLQKVGAARENYRYEALGLALEFPVRFAQDDYGRMDEAVARIKELLAPYPDTRDFCYGVINEYCQYLIHIGRASDAMLEARAMERQAGEEHSDLGRMYAHRIIGLIQSYRSNAHLAVQNFTRSAEYCVSARFEQEIPNLYLLIAQEYIRMGDFDRAAEFCAQAEAYQEYFPSLRVKTRMTRAYLFNAQQDWDGFWNMYDALEADPLYRNVTEDDERYGLDVAYLQSRGLFREALARADSLSTARDRHERKHGIYAAQGSFADAYGELSLLMSAKDSIYINVQNEDMAILDAEMNNAQLRQDAERLKARNQITILLGFLVMFVIAFFAILFSQWQLRQNLDEMRRKNEQNLETRRVYHKMLESKEAENATKLQILQNRTTNRLTGYEEYLNL